MRKLDIPLRGWDTESPIQSQVRNMRLVQQALVPRPQPKRFLTLQEPLATGEKFQGITLQTKPDGNGALGDLYVAYTKGAQSGSRIWIKRFNLSFGPTPVYLTDNVAANQESNYFTGTNTSAGWLSLGDTLYLNVGSHLFDVDGYTYPIKLFQCNARQSVTNLDESHNFIAKNMSWNAGDAVNATGAYNAGTTAYDVSYTGDFVFSFSCATGTFGLNCYEFPFFCTLSNINPGVTKVTVEFYDGSGNLLGPTKASIENGLTQENFVLDLSDPTVMRRRSVFLHTPDLFPLARRVSKIKFTGTGTPGAGTFSFRLGYASGIKQSVDGYYTLPTAPIYTGLTFQTSQGLPYGVGLPSSLFQDTVPTQVTTDAVSLDGYTLVLALPWASSPARTTTKAWCVGADGEFRNTPTETEDTGSPVNRYWYFWDLRDEVFGKADVYMGWDFPHVETATTPVILDACFWNGRLCMLDGNGLLWISDASDSFAFGGASDGDQVSLPQVAYQIVARENVLYLVCADGIWVLSGKPGDWLLSDMITGSGKNTGWSKSLLLLREGIWSTNLEELSRPIRPELDSDQLNYLEWGKTNRGYYGVLEDVDTGSRFMWEQWDGAWSKFDFDETHEMIFHTASFLPGQGLVLAGSDGLYKLNGDTNTTDWEASYDVRFPVKSKIVAISVDGVGRGKIMVNNLPETAKEVDFPGTVYCDLFQEAVQQRTATITLSGTNVAGSEETVIESVSVFYEPLESLETGNLL